ncbi:MAG: AbrB/MazE/SpoVT family DNA-binding domain-containing protein [Dehalococcoidales bacterium]|nr:AbrB/MazE/SpoVT family DNA-binding domain-containing protein [Dehalococcoidales bacterium]
MGSGIKSRIVKIGNSRGIRIPKILIDQAKLGDEIEVEVEGNTLIIRSLRNPRQGWDEQFSKMARRGDDLLLDSDTLNLSSWDKNEWEWK